jgi:hypothetical protein
VFSMIAAPSTDTAGMSSGEQMAAGVRITHQHVNQANGLRTSMLIKRIFTFTMFCTGSSRFLWSRRSASHSYQSNSYASRL